MHERHGDDRLNRLRSDSEHLVVALERTDAPGAPVVVTRGDDVDGAIGTDEDVHGLLALRRLASRTESKLQGVPHLLEGTFPCLRRLLPHRDGFQFTVVEDLERSRCVHRVPWRGIIADCDLADDIAESQTVSICHPLTSGLLVGFASLTGIMIRSG